MTRRMRTVTARAHAKVNLHLGVGDLRPDGYHDLVSVFQSLNLSDTVTLELAPDTDRVSEGTIVSGLSVTGMDAASVPTDDTNLAWRAVDKLVDHYRGHHDLEEAQPAAWPADPPTPRPPSWPRTPSSPSACRP